MATPAQITANRANASLSTGPVSEAGKQKSSLNRRTHGFRSTNVLLPGDDPAEYQALLEELTAHFEPQDLTEQRFVREMADAEWRLRRARDFQQAILTRHCDAIAAANPDMDPFEVQVLAFEAAQAKSSLSALHRYETQFQRQYDRAYAGLLSTRERVSRQQLRDSRAAMNNYLAAPVPVLPFEANLPPVTRPVPPAAMGRAASAGGATWSAAPSEQPFLTA